MPSTSTSPSGALVRPDSTPREPHASRYQDNIGNPATKHLLACCAQARRRQARLTLSGGDARFAIGGEFPLPAVVAARVRAVRRTSDPDRNEGLVRLSRST